MNYLNRMISPTFGQRFLSSITAIPSSIFGDIKLREVAYPIAGKKPKFVKDSKEAVAIIKSGSHIFVHGIAATPTPLLDGLCEHAKVNDLKKITLHHMHLEGHIPWLASDVKDRIRSNSLFTGQNLRNAVNDGTADFNSIFLHEIPLLFRSGAIHLDAALITVSPPDSNGFCTLGTSVDCARAAIISADHIIEAETKIGELIANQLVSNGATLQMGIGAVPDAALNALCNHKNLGIHTEMFSDGILKLVECNAITNAEKSLHPGKMVVSWVNDPSVVKTMPKMTAINSAVEVDITGQVGSDSVGSRFLSGFGGQVDFIRSAAISVDGLGKPIIALTSLTKKGQSKIVPYLCQGAGVVTSRAHVHYVVTEYGIAQLWGKNMRQRAYELIRISHPNHRENLEKAAFERLKVMPSLD
ncbi:4-hydroxybutyrate coenzyme A transferase [Dirofilaria immitis]|nr:4-hydroxybutyrate coenzyme A transferase [Dirofilaria immitis]